jgi:aminomethyltransferase
MKRTPLYSIHIEAGAKMTPFAGFEMPVVYSGIKEEHMAVRNSVGIFDVSHMGEFIIRGKEALDLIQKISSNDASRLEIGDAQYSCMPNDQGGIIDDLIVYRLPEDQCSEGEKAFMLVVNASNIEKDWAWIESNNSFDTRMINISDHTALLAVQGPKAIDTLQKLTDIDLSDIGFYTFVKGAIAGLDNVLISATGYTGSGGFELYVQNSDAEKLWKKVMEAGKEYGIQPCGLGARDTLRLEMGYCLYGNDIDDETSPLEAGLGWITKLKKNADFNSKDYFIQQKAEGLKRKLVGLVVKDRRVPRKGYELMNEEGEIIGVVTSGTQSPMLDIPVGMGYVNTEYSNAGTSIKIKLRNKAIEAEIKRPPFVEVKK